MMLIKVTLSLATTLLLCACIEIPAKLSNDRDTAITQLLQAAKTPGAALLIIQNGQVSTAKGYGLADVETQRAVTPDTLFTIASISKTVTATALMTLYEQGKWQLDDDINAYLPFSVRNPNFPDTPITFRMLLTHTSSIQDGEAYEQHYTLQQTPVLPDSPLELGEFLHNYLHPAGALYAAKQHYSTQKPGATYSYSNIGFGLLGYLTERISGMPFEQYCQQAVFKPLGMTRTAWHFRDIDTQRMAIPYGYDDSLKQPKPYGFYGYPTYPDGALKTSVNEFARFLTPFLNEGKTLEGIPFLQPTTINTMLTTQTLPGLSPSAIGLAWHFEGDYYGHTGSDPGISTFTYFQPKNRQAIIFFTNGGDPLSTKGILRSAIFDARIEALLKNSLATTHTQPSTQRAINK